MTPLPFPGSGDISSAALSPLAVLLVLAPGFPLMALALLAVLLYTFQFPVTGFCRHARIFVH